MDKFLTSGFGERSLQISNVDVQPLSAGNRNSNRTQSYNKTGPGGGGGSNLLSYM